MRTHLSACLPASLLVFFPLSAAVADPLLIVPGRSVGQTSLGLNGDKALAHLTPTASDASMGGKMDAVWRAPHGKDTLYVHTHRNDMGDPPRPGDTVTEIRITSRRFHTRSGLAPGSTLAEIRRRLPGGRVTAGGGHFYMAARQGIAFEFARPLQPASRCVSVTIFPPSRDGDAAGPESAAQVQDILSAGN